MIFNKILHSINLIFSLESEAGHLVSNIRQGMLHRAFSVFLFNSERKLLMQQRAAQKVTYPMYWTNTCCSHPLNSPDEVVEENQIGMRKHDFNQN